MKKHIPEETVARLPVYHRYLQSLTKQGVKNISSKKLATLLKINDSQVRKDLSYFGKFGRQGSGYDVIKLRDSIENILDIKKDEIFPAEKMIKNKGKERSMNMFFDLGIKECKS